MTDTIDQVVPILEPVLSATPAPESENTPEDKQVTMSQTALNKLITSRMGAAGKLARQEAEALRLENERLKTVVSGTGSADELERTKGLLAEERLRNQSVLDKSIAQSRDLIIAEQSNKHGFVDTSTLQQLTRQNLRHNAESGVFEVVDESGNPRLNIAGDPLSVTEFFADYGNKKPYLVRGTVVSGTGSSGSGSSVPPPNPYDPAKLWGPNAVPDASRILNAWALRDKHAYSRARAVAKEKGWVL